MKVKQINVLPPSPPLQPSTPKTSSSFTRSGTNKVTWTRVVVCCKQRKPLFFPETILSIFGINFKIITNGVGYSKMQYRIFRNGSLLSEYHMISRHTTKGNFIYNHNKKKMAILCQFPRSTKVLNAVIWFASILGVNFTPNRTNVVGML